MGSRVRNPNHPLVVLSLLFLPLSSCAISAKLAQPARILLLGDSISIGYLKGVREILGEEAVIVRPYILETGKNENCEGTTKGVKAVNRWINLDGGNWDVIHFNFGLHDIKRVHPNTRKNSNNSNHPQQAPLKLYITQLREITESLKITDADLVFATTTPVPAGKVQPHRDPVDVIRYNLAAKQVMAELQIPVNDLHAFALPKLMEIQMPRNVHFTKEGSQILAGQVCRSIRHNTSALN